MWSAKRALAVAVLLAMAVAGPVAAEAPDRISFEIVAYHASREPGPIDPAAAELHARLSEEFRYKSLKRLRGHRMHLRLDEIGGLELPSGRWIRVRPLSIARDRVLVAVQVEGAMETDLRMRNHRRVVIGAPYKEGKLVITLRSDF